MKVVWTNEALNHLDSIYHYIAKDNPYYAKRVIDNLTARTKQLHRFPELGRLVPEYEAEALRELIESPYRIIYYVIDKQVEILTVFHGAQQLPSDL